MLKDHVYKDGNLVSMESLDKDELIAILKDERRFFVAAYLHDVPKLFKHVKENLGVPVLDEVCAYLNGQRRDIKSCYTWLDERGYKLVDDELHYNKPRNVLAGSMCCICHSEIPNPDNVHYDSDAYLTGKFYCSKECFDKRNQ